MRATVWNNIEAKLVFFMQKEQAERLRGERCNVMRKRFTLFDEAVTKARRMHRDDPSLRDILVGIPQIREAMEMHLNKDMHMDAFDLDDLLEPFVDEWKADTRAYLADLVRKVSAFLPTEQK